MTWALANIIQVKLQLLIYSIISALFQFFCSSYIENHLIKISGSGFVSADKAAYSNTGGPLTEHSHQNITFTWNCNLQTK